MDHSHFAELSLEFNRHIVNLLDSLSALAELAQLSIHEMDESTLLRQALAALMANQDMERCSIFLLDAEGLLNCAAGLDWDEMLRGNTATELGVSTTPRRQIRYRRDAGVMGQAARDGMLVHCRSCDDDERFKQYAATAVQGSLLCVPIVCEKQVLGVLNVFHPIAEFFNMWHERLVLLFCQSLGRLLSNHRLTHHLNILVEAKTAEYKRSEDALRMTSQRLQEAQRIAHIGSWERDFATNRMSCSTEMRSIVGLARCGECDHCSFAKFVAAIHPEDREQFATGYATAIAQQRPFESTQRIIQDNSSICYVRIRCETSYDADAKPVATLGTIQDVTLSMLAEMSLRESEERFRTIADYTYDWEYWEGPQGEILYCSPSCKDLTGYDMSDFVMHPELLYQIIHPEDRHLMEAHRIDLCHEHAGSTNFRIVRRDGAIRWIAHGCRRVFRQDGHFMGRRASNRDITELKEAEERIRQLAYYDTLTGLPNRRLLLDRLAHALAQARRFERALAVMFLDLDRFKQINDTLGHSAGDALLKQVAERLAACVREGDTVARPGGDEFVIVLTEVSQPDDAAHVAEKIIASFIVPFVISGAELHVTTSIGIALYPVNGTDDIDELMKKADMAMYRAKEAGRNDYRFSDRTKE